MDRGEIAGAEERADGGNPALVALLRAAMEEAGGSISFADYMDLALFASAPQTTVPSATAGAHLTPGGRGADGARWW